MLRNFIKRTFEIRDGELRISFFMQLYIFLVITVLLIVKPTVNALFLKNLGAENLALGYLLVAIVAVMTSYFYGKSIKRFSLKNVTVFSLFLFGIGFAIFGLLLNLGLINQQVLYFYYVFVALFAVISTSQFWIIANLIFNAREAKRLFGFIGAGAIAGGIFGGYLTTILASLTNNAFLILLASVLILSCIPILYIIWRIRLRRLNTYLRKQRKNQLKVSYRSSFRLILNSKHLAYLALIVGISVLVAKLVDYQFSDIANRSFADSEELASFFGFWFSTFNVVALCIQLFFTNRVLNFFGVTSTLLILPVSIALGGLLFFLLPELGVIILIKGIDGSFKQSINKAAIELSILPIPGHIKDQAKSYIDVVIDSIATGFAGFILIFLIKRLDLDSVYITVIILLLLFIWILLIYKLREAYFNSFRTNLQSSLTISKEKKRYKKENTLQSSLRILEEGTEEEILVLLDRIHNVKLKPLKNHIITLLHHPSEKIVKLAIEQLYAYDKGTAKDTVKQLLHRKNHEVVYAAMEYLLLHTEINNEAIFIQYLDHDTNYLSDAALLCLARESSTNAKLKIKYNLASRLEKRSEIFKEVDLINKDPEIAELLITLGYSNLPQYYRYIEDYLKSDNPYLVKHAIKAAGLTKQEIFIKPLLKFLPEKAYRKETIKALKSYGEEISKTLLTYELQENLDNQSKFLIPRVVQSFKNQDSIRILFRLLKSKDIQVRLEAAKSLLKLRNKQKHLKFNQIRITKLLFRESQYYKNTINVIASIQKYQQTLPEDSDTDYNRILEINTAKESLIILLKSQLETNLECIFTLLRLKYNESDIEVAYLGLKSDMEDVKINAMEFLDNLMHTKLKLKILPLIEYQVMDNSNDLEYFINSKQISESRSYRMLIKNRGKKTKIQVLKVLLLLRDKSYTSLIKALLTHKDKEVRNYAQIALQNLDNA